MDFTLEDMKFLKETIMKEKSILEHEIQQITSQKASSIRMTFKDKYNKKWGKVRSTAFALGKMQSLKNMVKEYGTSVNLVGFTADRLEEFEKAISESLNEKKIVKKMLFSSNSKFLSGFWAPVLMFLLFYIAIETPYSIAFFRKSEIFNHMRNIFFLMDIFIHNL